MNRYDVSNVVDIDTGKMSTSLSFQDFEETPSAGPSRMNMDGGPQIPVDDPKPAKSFMSFEFYQQFFDVDTDIIVKRIKWSMIPYKNVNYLQHYIQSKPDLYGPLWISITLIFTIAISGNLANYLQTASTQKYHWRYDFHAVSFAATAIFCYAWLLPLILWSYLKWYGHFQVQLSLMELICVYGYCLSIYVPVSVLWVIQVNWLQWLLVLVGAASSGSVLVTSLYSVLNQRNYFLILIVLCLHLLLAVSFMLYFFHVPSLHPEMEAVVIPKNGTNM